MQSAFGVDHGEVSKGINPNKLARLLRVKGPSGERKPGVARPGQMTGQLKNKLPRVSKGYPALPRAARKAARVQHALRAANTQPGGATKIKNALNRAGEADISLKGIGEAAGRGTKAVGGFLEKRPGLTGTALVGGGGAAGYKVLSDKQPRKKRP